jgi:tRNA threonylcarbamoyladenosine biosynthesis protein TsaE
MGRRQIISSSASETVRLAEGIGRGLQGGEVLVLTSDLGGGKTTFVRGLARGMGSQDTVRSPSFTLGNEYRVKNLTLYHFDFYRLSEPGIMREELAEALADPKAVVAVEWGHIIKDVLPEDNLAITLRATDTDRRELTLTYPKRLEYIMKNT